MAKYYDYHRISENNCWKFYYFQHVPNLYSHSSSLVKDEEIDIHLKRLANRGWVPIPVPNKVSKWVKFIFDTWWKSAQHLLPSDLLIQNEMDEELRQAMMLAKYQVLVKRKMQEIQDKVDALVKILDEKERNLTASR